MTNVFGSQVSHEIIRQLEDAGHEAVFVGGAVRDFLLGRPAKDIDIATSAEPHEVKSVFTNTIDIGIEHGTVLVIEQGEPIEVTTFRTEGTYTDHRRPDEVSFVKTLREDLLRRDFTMNALALTKDGELIDLFGGRTDLENRLIRAVGTAKDRFREDALRMLRAIRFSSVLDFDIEKDTLQAINDNASQMSHVSIERVKIEMDKLFLGNNPVKAFTYLMTSQLGAALPLFPSKIEQLEYAVPFSTASEGWAFLATVGQFQPAQLVQKYKLSNDERRFISSVHNAFITRINGEFTIDDYYHYDLAVLTSAEKMYSSFYFKSPTVTNSDIERKKQSLPIQSKNDLTIDGRDLIKWAGVRGGEWTGKWLEKIERAVLHGICENTPTNIKDWFTNDFEP